MKQIALCVLLILSTLATSAQSPQSMSYQAVLRNTAGVVIVNQNVNLRFSIIQSTPTGNMVYSETHNTMTNSLGSFNLGIGSGLPTSGVFASIDWGNGPYFLQTEIDTANGNYIIISTSQLLSVPYALYAENVSDATIRKGCIDTLTLNSNGIIEARDSLGAISANTDIFIRITTTTDFKLALTSFESSYVVYVNGQISTKGGGSGNLPSSWRQVNIGQVNSGDVIAVKFIFEQYPCLKILILETTVP